jgi:hypothetical protein
MASLEGKAMDKPEADTRRRTPDDAMSPDEKEDLEEQIEEFEGPDRREVRGTEEKPPKEPGVARS